MRRLLLATGGTGGHIYPALAVAREARERGWEPHLIGQAGGMEERLADEVALPFIGVASGKIDRQRPDPRALWHSLRGVSSAVAAVRRLRPAVAVGFGGFASFQGCSAALLTRTPLVLHEQNAYPGLVTRLLARFAHTVVASQPTVLDRVRAKRWQEIPYPVREERLERSEARRLLGLPAEVTLTLVMGGSQGSVALNEGVLRALDRLDEPPVVLHSTGPRHFDEVKARTQGLKNYYCRPYLDAVQAWSAADLAITRAGYGTLSEAAFHGVPVIAVPLPTSAENHQLHNARELERAGAGRVVEQKDIEDLPGVWQEMLEPQRLEAAAEAARRRSPEGAARMFLDLLERLASEGKPRTIGAETA